MGEIHPPCPAMLLVAAFSRHQAALAWARRRAIDQWGPPALESPVFEFNDTDYYEPTMGAGLQKTFFVFPRPFDPEETPGVKILTNRWEEEYARAADHPQQRPLNVDPGYLTLAKLVLASTKDHAHRIYLARGIYAEVTLFYRHGRWQSHQWTYPDYRRADYQEFFLRCREHLQERQEGGPRR